MNNMVGLLKRFGSTLNCDTRVKIFNAFIKLQITFALPVWGNADAGCITSMDRTLRHAARVICRNKMAELDKNVYDVTLILPFRFQTLQSNVIRIFNTFTTNSISYYLDCNIMSSSHETRSSKSHKLMSLTYKKANDALCFQCAVVRDWNSLPFNISYCNNFKQFSSKLNYFICNHLS